MTYLYEFQDLDNTPNQGILSYKVKSSGLVPEWSDISFHPEKKWLKIWFNEKLSEEEESLLGSFVSDSLGVKHFQIDAGSIFFELQDSDKKRWQKHTKRVSFNIAFSSIPTIQISDAYFDGAADIEIINTTRKYFDFRVVSTQSKVNSKGFNSLEFTWEARSWSV